MTTLFRARVTALDNGWLTQAPHVAVPPGDPGHAQKTSDLPAGDAGHPDARANFRPARGPGGQAPVQNVPAMFVVSDGHSVIPVAPIQTDPWAFREQFHLTPDEVLDEIRNALQLHNINWGEASKVVASVSDQIAPSIVVASIDKGFFAITSDPRDAPTNRAPGLVMLDQPDEPWKEDGIPSVTRHPRPMKRFGFVTQEQLLGFVQQWMVDHQDWAQEHDRNVRVR